MVWLMVGAHAASLGTVQVDWDKKGRLLTVQPPQGQEIAADAPVDASLTIGERRLELSGDGSWLAEGVQLGGLTGAVDGVLDLQLCDKSSGVCAPASWHVTGELPDSKKGSLALAVAAPEADDHGSVFNQDRTEAVEQAYAAAKASGDRVLLDFSAIWCPPCNALAAEVLHAPDAEEQLQGFQVVVVDVDHPSSWPIKSRYEVGGYPTVVITDAEGNEVDRIEGYPGRDAFLSKLSTAGKPSELADDRKAMRDAPDAEKLKALLEQAPHLAVDILYENLDWAKQDGKQAVLELIPGLMTDLKAPAAADLLWIRAKLEPEAQRPATYATAAALLKASWTGGPGDRAHYSFYSHLLSDAGQLDEAVAFLDGLSRENPDDPTFLLDAALALNEHEQYAEALRRADMAAPLSWGDIALRVEHAACEALVGLDRGDEAAARAKAILASQAAPDESLKVRTHKYRKKLEAFLE